MKILKISNILEPHGAIDYKGLDIDKFKAGTQLYSNDLQWCVLYTNEDDYNQHPDIVELGETTYHEIRDAINQEQTIIFETQEQKIQRLEGENAKLKDDMANTISAVDFILMNF